MRHKRLIPDEDFFQSTYKGQNIYAMKRRTAVCPRCGRMSEILTIVMVDRNMVDGELVDYTTIHDCCQSCETLFDDEDMMSFNHASMRLAHLNKQEQ